MTFKELDLIEPILKALQQTGYTTPTPIQEQAIPVLLKGKDLLGCAQTGTGKTAAFAIPLIQRLYQSDHKKGIKALILTPTRELAIQIGENFDQYAGYTGVKHAVIFGGVPQKAQVDALKRGVQVLIATPGRLLDLQSQGCISLKGLEYFVLDEADRMLDMGFIHDIKKVLKLIPARRQTLFFSATMPSEIEKLADSMLTNPEKIEVTPVSSTVDTIRQSHGIVSYACQKVGITRACYYKWRDSDLKFKERAEEVEEETIDVVESKLLSAINNDDLTAIIFYLKTKGKKRGYVERVEQDVNVNPFESLIKELPDKIEE